MLSSKDFQTVVENAPLFAIDLVVVNDQREVLLGLRSNAPAKGYWFVPGGRVFKNESLENAFKRISKSEIGIERSINHARFIGLYEHFYPDSAVGSNVSTHYINATHLLRLEPSRLSLPFSDQHQEYRWLAIDELAKDTSVHHFSKVFLDKIGGMLQ